MNTAANSNITTTDVAILGSGPSGLSAAARCAELGLSHTLFESSSHLADTIFKYQKGKPVMNEPGILPLRASLPFAAAKREAVLQSWADRSVALGINVAYGHAVTAISGNKGAFTVTFQNGAICHAGAVVLAIGVQGNLRKLEIPGADHPGVIYQLDSAEAFSDETIVVVGAGDSAIENAVALAKQNRVMMLVRGEEFSRCKDGNLTLVNDAIRAKRIDVRFRAGPSTIESSPELGDMMRLTIKTATGVEPVLCHRILARLGATPPRKLIESFGIEFSSSAVDSVPPVSAQYESNVPGIYIIGALAGYPLIKQAINQGYEAVEAIVGRRVEPADEALLRDRLKPIDENVNVSATLDWLRARVSVLKPLSTLQMREVLLESRLLAPSAGTLLYARNDYTNSFYAVIEGSVRLLTQGSGDAGAELTAGQCFGQMGLISGRRRADTASAGGSCMVLEIPRRTMRQIMTKVPEVSAAIDSLVLRTAIHTQIAPGLSRAETDVLVAEARLMEFAAGETLYREGDAPNGLYLIRRGSVFMAQTRDGVERILSYVASGNYVGETAVINNKPYTETVRTTIATECIVLDAERFKRVVEANPKLRQQLEAGTLARIAANAAQSSGKRDGLMAFLAEAGLGEATDVLLIDEDLCVRCDNCEKACADTHKGTSRLDREAGTSFANIHVPTSCRHCENPHCMKDCPPNAIHRQPTGEVTISDACIGCGNCEANCPYGVIALAPANPKYKPASGWAWLWSSATEAKAGTKGKAYDKDKSGDQKKVAVKCDMCFGLPAGPACVRSCPTGAAIRVSPEQYLATTGARR